MTASSDDEQRIVHSEAGRFLSRLELDTAARIARRAAQLGFLTAANASQPVRPRDLQQFFPELDDSSLRHGRQ